MDMPGPNLDCKHVCSLKCMQTCLHLSSKMLHNNNLRHVCQPQWVAECVGSRLPLAAFAANDEVYGRQTFCHEKARKPLQSSSHSDAFTCCKRLLAFHIARWLMAHEKVHLSMSGRACIIITMWCERRCFFVSTLLSGKAILLMSFKGMSSMTLCPCAQQRCCRNSCCFRVSNNP